MPDASFERITAAVLAAGRATRMRGAKMLSEVGGVPLVRRVVAAAAEAGLSRILVVVNRDTADHVLGALADLPVEPVVNDRFAEGMGTSIASAASALAPETDALVLLQGDQPFVGADMLHDLLRLWRAAAAPFVASRFGGVVTTPVVFDRRLCPELARLGGDRGARSVLDRHAGHFVDFPEWRGVDVDTPADLDRARGVWEAQART